MAAALSAAAAALLHAARPVKAAGGAWVRAATATLEPSAAGGGVPLHLHAWLPACGGAPLAGLVVGVHGLNEHGAHGFGPHAGAFAAARLGLLAVDLPGHGRSTSPSLPLGRSAGYEAALAAVVRAGGVGARVAALLAELAAGGSHASSSSSATEEGHYPHTPPPPPLPLFYMGASFGATLALDAACRINAAAAVAAAAAADAHAPPPWMTAAAAATASLPGDCDGLAPHRRDGWQRAEWAARGGDGSLSLASPLSPSGASSSSSSFPLGAFRAGLGGQGAGVGAAAGPLRSLHSCSSGGSSSSSSAASERSSVPLPHPPPPPLRISGVVAQAPLVTPAPGVAPRWYHGPALRLLSAVGAGGAPLMRGVTGGCGRAYHPAHRSHRVAEDAADGRVYMGPLTVGTAATLRDAMARAAQLAPLLSAAGGGGGAAGAPLPLPVLLQHGTDDGLCDVAGSRALAAAAARSDGGGTAATAATAAVTLAEYAGAHHDLLRERPEVAAAVVRDAVRWIAGRCPTSGAG